MFFEILKSLFETFSNKYKYQKKVFQEQTSLCEAKSNIITQRVKLA